VGRAEAFAMANPPWQSFLDGVGNGLGYGIILIGVAFFRELLGSGTLFGFTVVPAVAYELGYANMGLMVLAPGAFIILGLMIWAQRTYTGYAEED
jgi:Na+-transporting NADH:ubiquinone oxidoreductase subunit D